jgi:hypothetical protein
LVLLKSDIKNICQTYKNLGPLHKRLLFKTKIDYSFRNFFNSMRHVYYLWLIISTWSEHIEWWLSKKLNNFNKCNLQKFVQFLQGCPLSSKNLFWSTIDLPDDLDWRSKAIVRFPNRRLSTICEEFLSVFRPTQWFQFRLLPKSIWVKKNSLKSILSLTEYPKIHFLSSLIKSD